MQDVATDNDILQCNILAQQDTMERREEVSAAHQLIYEAQYVVNTPQVEELLKSESLVPTIVCVQLDWEPKWSFLLQPSRMPFQKGSVH